MISPSAVAATIRPKSGRRAETENVPGIVGLGQECENVAVKLEQQARHMQETRNRLELGLAAALTDIRLNGHRQLRSGNNKEITGLGKDYAATQCAISA